MCIISSNNPATEITTHLKFTKHTSVLVSKTIRRELWFLKCFDSHEDSIDLLVIIMYCLLTCTAKMKGIF